MYRCLSAPLLEGCPKLADSPLLVMHLWDVDLVTRENYTRAK